MRRKFGLKMQQDIKNYYGNGLSTHKIGRRLNISSASVFGILRKQGVQLRGQYDYEYSKYKFKWS